MAKRTQFIHPDEPLKLLDHGRPKTRREFISQGFSAGSGAVVGTSMLSMMLAHNAHALSPDIDELRSGLCDIKNGAGKIPFICFDLAGGANITGSNVLVGGVGGQRDFLSNAGYSKQGLPANMAPGGVEAGPSATGTSLGDFTDDSLGLLFHSDSGFLRGIHEKTGDTTRANVNGAVIAARSENDTGNNPHNPMYAVSMAGARGQLLSLIGSRSSESGGNSLSPASMIDLAVRPTKIDRPSDVTGLVDVGDFGALSPAEVVAVMESVSRISDDKLAKMKALRDAIADTQRKQPARCAYVKSAHLAETFPDPSALDPSADSLIVDALGAPGTGIFTEEEFNNEREYQKTASVMKLVIDGHAGAGTITMGGYDYHTGDRSTGEARDERAGRCMGACLEYAARRGQPLMMYVFTDGSVFSNGTGDNSEGGRGKGVWTGDNQQTSSAFFLVFNPTGRPLLASPDSQQIGYMRASGDVETSSSPAANNVNLLVQTVMLNYMALNGETADFENKFLERGQIHGLGSASARDRLIAFQPLQ